MRMVRVDDGMDFGDGWDPDPETLRIVTDYLKTAPEQGEWDWEDHCEGLAGGLLYALHKQGREVIDLPRGGPSNLLGHTTGTDTWTLAKAIEFFAHRSLLHKPSQKPTG